MAGFGSLAGGAGGFGASYPTRVGMPNSQAVDYLRPQEEWQSDWDARYQAEASKARAAGMRSVEGRPDAPTSAANWTDSTGISSGWGAGIDPNATIAANRSSYSPDAPIPTIGQTMTIGANSNYHPDAPTATWGPTFELNGYQGQPSTGSAPTVYNDYWDPGYTPDFSALNAEKEQMMGRYDAQGRNQQAYDIMNGGNQINGIIGPEYTNPNFGRITGAQPQAPNPEDMQWADGLYNATGTYSTAPGRTQGWSLW